MHWRSRAWSNMHSRPTNNKYHKTAHAGWLQESQSFTCNNGYGLPLPLQSVLHAADSSWFSCKIARKRRTEKRTPPRRRMTPLSMLTWTSLPCPKVKLVHHFMFSHPNSANYFSGKRPSITIENEKSEYAEITPQVKEWTIRREEMRFMQWKEKSLSLVREMRQMNLSC